jgi:hypothetical protein
MLKTKEKTKKPNPNRSKPIRKNQKIDPNVAQQNAQIFQRFSNDKPSTIVVWVRSAVVDVFVVVRSGGSEHVWNQLVKTYCRRDPAVGLGGWPWVFKPAASSFVPYFPFPFLSSLNGKISCIKPLVFLCAICSLLCEVSCS